MPEGADEARGVGVDGNTHQVGLETFLYGPQLGVLRAQPLQLPVALLFRFRLLVSKSDLSLSLSLSLCVCVRAVIDI